MLGCSSSQKAIKTSSVNKNVHSTHVTLSHVKAYLLLGDIQKAEQLFQTIEAAELNAQAMLTLAELHAAKGNSVKAQMVFLSALTDNQFELPPNEASTRGDLLDYLCAQKKWPALQGYGAAIKDIANVAGTTLTNNINIKNGVLTKIGLCFFYQQRWGDTKYWLEQVDLNERVNPLIYLALARAHIEQQQYLDAQSLITQYEQKKDTVDAQTLWVAIEVYLALKQPDKANQLGEIMRSLFHYNQYTREYILLTKRGRILAVPNNPTPSPTLISSLPTPSKPNNSVDRVHIIRKGETLYQLTKKYKVTLAQVLIWNPNLVIDDILVGTKIKLGPEQN
jgi:Tfp pilus assembly protein PilF